jgi:hypothetical protein
VSDLSAGTGRKAHFRKKGDNSMKTASTLTPANGISIVAIGIVSALILFTCAFILASYIMS